MEVDNIILEKIIENALIEDIGPSDITTDNIFVDTNNIETAQITAKDKGVLAGGFVVKKVFDLIDQNIIVDLKLSDGQEFEPGTLIASIEGRTDKILKGERTALNFVQRLSGIATKTREMVNLASPYGVKILDTRKTTPTLRYLEKYAVRAGGGINHRMGLYDGVMIKDNHKKAAGSIKNALEKLKSNLGPMVKICVEATNKEEAEEAYYNGADQILLDNMSPEVISEIVKKIGDEDKRAENKIVKFEVSGNIGESDIKALAKTGIDFISSGKITHSYNSIDFSLNF
ncbi:carboxylating nicotinate-nucleotide diphosphorylase [Natranaerofaba carboxydovora]|uniref:carboxylating nicotinate-nucleotide diphosphorylase n=1 Tax=Natranaerofaba carboxydovora TaxID=2742683 RepID=UPI001F1397DF|nr:carboxylating nicotinate-nucleotide diphosphorylase [Natranaerofaba carboxydovora]UMZ74844.1 putative nicotinate-nucleotide pyrophosphorylase [carboxylating] [Natranaerofaba carboxydovora]